MELGVGLNKTKKTYNGTWISWDNIEIFSIEFLKILGALKEFDVERIKNDQKLSVPSQVKRDLLIKELHTLYKIIMSIRLTIKANYENNEVFQKWFDKKAENDSIFWINALAYTYDPRLVNYDLPAIIPLILYPSQIKLIKLTEETLKNNQKLYIDKSRREGATEILCAWSAWAWKYKPGIQIVWVSRILKMVDLSDDPDTIFPRLKRFILSMPKNMLPTGFQRNKRNNHIKHMRITNPDNGATIKGAGGDDPNRGGSGTIVFVDEFASVNAIEGVLTALNECAECHIYITTPKGQNGAYDLKMSGTVRTYSLWWYNSPRKNENGYYLNKRPDNNFTYWRKWKDLTDDEFSIRQEIEIDYTAFVDGVMIPRDWILAAINFECENKGDVAGGLDLSGGGKDLPVFTLRRGIRVKKDGIIVLPRNVTPLQQARLSIKECEKAGAIQLAYDKVGMGLDVIEERKNTNINLEGIVGQAKPPPIPVKGEEGDTGDMIFANLRAWLWWDLRTRFKKTFQHVNNIQKYPEEELISIPSHGKLITELSTPKVIYNGGKIQVESKDSMKSRNIQSPNYADSLAYAFAPIRALKLIKINGIENISVDKARKITGFMYSSWHYLENGDMYCIYAGIDKPSKKLVVVKEFFWEAGTDPTNMKLDIEEFEPTFGHMKNLINKLFYKDITDDSGIQKWYFYKRKGLNFNQNWRYNPEVSFSDLNKLASNGRIEIDKNECPELVTQCVTAKKEDFLKENKNYLAIALLNLVNFILVQDVTKYNFCDIL
ncbi:MAG: hypothetical protein ACTSYW_00410 [Candidatus Heimdallarchaeota archaeon]